MQGFGWRKSQSDDDLPGRVAARERSFMTALPPSDPSVRELEILLAQAKVGTHEFAYVAMHHEHQQQQQGLRSEQTISLPRGSHGGDPRQEHTPEQEPRPEPPSSHGSEEESVILNDSSSSSDNSGVLVEPPSDCVPDAVFETPAAESATEKLVLVATGGKGELSQNTALVLFRGPKLRFFTDEKTIPDQLNNLQHQAMRKRHTFQTLIHDLDCKVALLTARLAEESMDLDLELRHAMETSVYKPLEAAYEKLSLERYGGGSSTTSLTQHWMTLERRLSTVDSQMTHSVHVDLQDVKREHLTSLQEELEYEVLPDFKQENVTSDKRETATARRWECQVGIMARRFEEERATRVALLTVADTKLQEFHPRRGEEEVLSQITALRKKLECERTERKAQDDRIRAYILERTDAMKQAILEAYPDPDI